MPDPDPLHSEPPLAPRDAANGPAPAAAARAAHRLRRVLLVGATLFSLLVVGTGAAYVAFLNHTVTTNVQHESLLPTLPAGGELAAAPPTPLPVNPAQRAPTKAATAKNAMNLLLIGSDSWGSVSAGRSDVIVLVHISDDRKRVDLVHFPRDLYVDIPGHGKNKINAAFAYGGAPLLVQTLQGLVDVPIDHVGLIGFDGFKAMTDALGGVDVHVEEASSGFRVGRNHLTGEQALAFVRERKQLSQGDISRGRRQMAVVKALMLKGLSRDTLTHPLRLAAYVDAATSNLTVDNEFSIKAMRSLLFSMRNLRGDDISFVTAPYAGFGTTASGASIDIVDSAGMARLSNALRQDAMRGYGGG